MTMNRIRFSPYQLFSRAEARPLHTRRTKGGEIDTRDIFFRNIFNPPRGGPSRRKEGDEAKRTRPRRP
jgi:hypothetical protein